MCVCAHMTRYCSNGSCAIVMNPKTISPGVLFPPSQLFVTVRSLTRFPSFRPPLSPPHCFLCFTPICLTRFSPPWQTHTELQWEVDLNNRVEWYFILKKEKAVLDTDLFIYAFVQLVLRCIVCSLNINRSQMRSDIHTNREFPEGIIII